MVDIREMFLSHHSQDLHGRQLGQSILVSQVTEPRTIITSSYHDFIYVIYDFQHLLQSEFKTVSIILSHSTIVV